MYESHFGLSERPFSIAPDPQYLYMSRQHQEAMAHLSYGLTQGGGFILLTGEVGTGKTTLCRNLLSALPHNIDVALILNANIQGDELLQTICDELKITYEKSDTQKTLLNKLNKFLLDSFAEKKRTVLIIDEAQLLSRDVLEQIRLLTNLETTKTKLLQIILIGQPELNDLLLRQDLRQLAQRITARYHLKSIDKNDIAEYVTTRLKVAGCSRPLFTKQALTKVFKLTKGIPRLINVLCDNALLVAYSKESALVDARMVKVASREILTPVKSKKIPKVTGFLNANRFKFASILLTSLIAGGLLFSVYKFLPLISQNNPESNEVENVKESIKPLTNSGGDVTNQAVVLTDDHMEPSIAFNEVSKGDVTEIAELGVLLGSPNIDTSRVGAFRQLAREWGLSLPEKAIKPLCESVRDIGLDCFVSNAKLDEIIDLNRPSSIVLNTEEGLHRVLLIGANQKDLLLKIDGADYITSREQVESLWTGAYLIYWQRPEVSSFIFTEGAVGSRVVWLRQQINFALRKLGRTGLSNTTNTVYDAELMEKVREFQQSQSISADGDVGMKTLMAINEIIDPSIVPTLKEIKSELDESSVVLEQEL